MSTVKVNKVTPRTCNSLQLGESGDTLTIPAGATLQNCGTATGFGISFCTTVKTSPFTATAGKGFFINTGSAVTVTLPASPSTGDELIVIDSTGQAATNNITLGRNGSKIKGGCIDATIDVNRGGLRIVYSGASQGWVTATAGNDAKANTTKFVTATGGTITECGNFKIHTFTASGCFQVTCAGNPSGSTTVDYLVVAGGGGGANAFAGGGGGAGGYRESSGGASGCYTRSPLGACVAALPVSVQTYPITVGAGGTSPYPSNSGVGALGSNSIFSTITSAGGGGGSSGYTAPGPGNNGGSGGGAGGLPSQTRTGGSGNTPPVSPPQGNNGGNAANPGNYGSGGGGGAGAVGANASGTTAGPGGNGVASSITGSPVTRAGGGGGGTEGSPNGTGGSGGGGIAGPGPSTAPGPGSPGTVNTGGGGGGASRGTGSSGDSAGGSGGSGVVVIRYKFQ